MCDHHASKWLKKNLMYNALDIISKVFFGIGLWGYYGGVIGL